LTQRIRTQMKVGITYYLFARLAPKAMQQPATSEQCDVTPTHPGPALPSLTDADPAVGSFGTNQYFGEEDILANSRQVTAKRVW
jgi:hypothetical protein